MLKVVIGVALAAHGVGHVMGPLKVFDVAAINPDWHGGSWLLSRFVGDGPAEGLGIVLWVVAMVAFLALAGVVAGWLPVEWWAPVGIVAATSSLAAIVLFPVAFPVFSSVAAAAIDIAVLVAILWADWSPSDLPA